MVEIDVRGLSCPIPVVKTKQAIEKTPDQGITVILDSEVSKENVIRLASSMGYETNYELVINDYRLSLTPRK